MRLGIRAAIAFSVLLLLAIGETLTQGQTGSWQAAPPTSPKKQTRQTGVWRHFGDNVATTSTAVPSVGWHHFGEAVAPAPGPHEFALSPKSISSSIEGLEREMYELVNRDRSDPANQAETGGQALALRWNDQLSDVAWAHSLDMMSHGYFGHVDPQGRSVANRVEAAGMEWRAVGENIAIYDSVESAEAAFMNEPRFRKNHRANILSSNYTDVGIGIVQAPGGRFYITQDFYTQAAASR